jgi:hypothetical protein
MAPLCSAGRTAYRGREPPQFCQPHTIARCEGSDKSARAATIFIHNGAPQALVGCLGRLRSLGQQAGAGTRASYQSLEPPIRWPGHESLLSPRPLRCGACHGPHPEAPFAEGKGPRRMIQRALQLRPSPPSPSPDLIRGQGRLSRRRASRGFFVRAWKRAQPRRLGSYSFELVDPERTPGPLKPRRVRSGRREARIGPRDQACFFFQTA